MKNITPAHQKWDRYYPQLTENPGDITRSSHKVSLPNRETHLRTLSTVFSRGGETLQRSTNFLQGSGRLRAFRPGGPAQGWAGPPPGDPARTGTGLARAPPPVLLWNEGLRLCESQFYSCSGITDANALRTTYSQLYGEVR